MVPNSLDKQQQQTKSTVPAPGLLLAPEQHEHANARRDESDNGVLVCAKPSAVEQHVEQKDWDELA